MAKTKAGPKTSNNTKQLTVTVDADDNVHVTPDHVKVQGKNVLLTFDLDTPGYIFAGTGAVVVTDPGSQFPITSWTLPPTSTTAVLLDLCTETGIFSYTVHVQKVSSGKRLWVDPIIENGP